MGKARVIAFYLPQYHPTLNNNIWWGNGFTEWVNVRKAKPLFKGHDQPKVPADLGYYDLRLPEVRYAQAKMAKNAGIEGFCYYHYWFEDGKEELDLPFKEVIRTGDPNYPFCLCWANESWHCKFWNMDGTATKKLLVEQKYLGRDDNEKHFYSLLPAFKDKRYMKCNGKLIFMIYRALSFDQVTEFMNQWNELAKLNGLEGFHFISQCLNVEDARCVLNLGFDGVNLIRLNNFAMLETNVFKKRLVEIWHTLLKKPYIYNYKRTIQILTGGEEYETNIYPTLVPNWDHTPRSGYCGYLLSDTKPEYFAQHVNKVLQTLHRKSEEDSLVFLKSWNEWGEGNYMEPDIHYGHAFLDTLKECLNKQ